MKNSLDLVAHLKSILSHDSKINADEFDNLSNSSVSSVQEFLGISAAVVAADVDDVELIEISFFAMLENNPFQGSVILVGMQLISQTSSIEKLFEYKNKIAEKNQWLKCWCSINILRLSKQCK